MLSGAEKMVYAAAFALAFRETQSPTQAAVEAVRTVDALRNAQLSMPWEGSHHSQRVIHLARTAACNMRHD